MYQRRRMEKHQSSGICVSKRHWMLALAVVFVLTLFLVLFNRDDSHYDDRNGLTCSQGRFQWKDRQQQVGGVFSLWI